eukprot:TRINITY_DN70227_c0_g1_i1.p1 TRINITY_DN70227_c0_g1~~TRINITY_DN70227_c0_g1_i1.p1  ORF type:complete len:660 (+),score=59.53 TRINITY_DN70227_c0_g1_i1:92-2071(+)
MGCQPSSTKHAAPNRKLAVQHPANQAQRRPTPASDRASSLRGGPPLPRVDTISLTPVCEMHERSGQQSPENMPSFPPPSEVYARAAVGIKLPPSVSGPPAPPSISTCHPPTIAAGSPLVMSRPPTHGCMSTGFSAPPGRLEPTSPGTGFRPACNSPQGHPHTYAPAKGPSEGSDGLPSEVAATDIPLMTAMSSLRSSNLGQLSRMGGSHASGSVLMHSAASGASRASLPHGHGVRHPSGRTVRSTQPFFDNSVQGGTGGTSFVCDICHHAVVLPAVRSEALHTSDNDVAGQHRDVVTALLLRAMRAEARCEVLQEQLDAARAGASTQPTPRSRPSCTLPVEPGACDLGRPNPEVPYVNDPHNEEAAERASSPAAQPGETSNQVAELQEQLQDFLSGLRSSEMTEAAANRVVQLMNQRTPECAHLPVPGQVFNQAALGGSTASWSWNPASMYASLGGHNTAGHKDEIGTPQRDDHMKTVDQLAQSAMAASVITGGTDPQSQSGHFGALAVAAAADPQQPRPPSGGKPDSPRLFQPKKLENSARSPPAAQNLQHRTAAIASEASAMVDLGAQGNVPPMRTSTGDVRTTGRDGRSGTHFFRVRVTRVPARVQEDASSQVDTAGSSEHRKSIRSSSASASGSVYQTNSTAASSTNSVNVSGSY